MPCLTRRIRCYSCTKGLGTVVLLVVLGAVVSLRFLFRFFLFGAVVPLGFFFLFGRLHLSVSGDLDIAAHRVGMDRTVVLGYPLSRLELEGFRSSLLGNKFGAFELVFAVVEDAFSPRALQSSESRIQEITRDLIDTAITERTWMTIEPDIYVL